MVVTMIAFLLFVQLALLCVLLTMKSARYQPPKDIYLAYYKGANDGWRRGICERDAAMYGLPLHQLISNWVDYHDSPIWELRVKNAIEEEEKNKKWHLKNNS